jgi:hypothetical protein
VAYLTGERTTVTDALGQTWRTGDIYETSVLSMIYGMGFITVLAALSLARRSPVAASATDGSAPVSSPLIPESSKP